MIVGTKESPGEELHRRKFKNVCGDTRYTSLDTCPSADASSYKETGRSDLGKLSNSLDTHIRRGIFRNRLLVVGIVPLSHKDSRHTRFPDLLDSGQDAQFVVHEH